jgi:hypothetical protein
VRYDSSGQGGQVKSSAYNHTRGDRGLNNARRAAPRHAAAVLLIVVGGGSLPVEGLGAVGLKPLL